MGFDIGAVLGAQVSKLDTREVVEIPLFKLLPNPKNFYNVEVDYDLVDSIKLYGVLEPLVVTHKGENYRIISGHRRLEALKFVNMESSTAPCIVIEEELDDDKEMLLLIEANRQRVKTPWEISEEAKRLTEAYTKAKKGGAELPGRIRNRVAEAMQENAARLGRLQAIENNLIVPGFQDRFKHNQIPESVAYAISRLADEAQYRFLDYSAASHEPLTEKLVKRFVKEQKTKTAEVEVGEKPETVKSVEQTVTVPLVWHPVETFGQPKMEGDYLVTALINDVPAIRWDSFYPTAGGWFRCKNGTVIAWAKVNLYRKHGGNR